MLAFSDGPHQYTRLKIGRWNIRSTENMAISSVTSWINLFYTPSWPLCVAWATSSWWFYVTVERLGITNERPVFDAEYQMALRSSHCIGLFVCLMMTICQDLFEISGSDDLRTRRIISWLSYVDVFTEFGHRGYIYIYIYIYNYIYIRWSFESRQFRGQFNDSDVWIVTRNLASIVSGDV